MFPTHHLPEDPMTTTDENTRIITLTNRAPVKIREDEWPVIAFAVGDSFRGDVGRYTQAKQQGEIDRYSLHVRQHADGRMLVYGVLNATEAHWRQPAGGDSRREGDVIAFTDDVAVTIRRVGERCNLPRAIIDACIADLPAVEL